MCWAFHSTIRFHYFDETLQYVITTVGAWPCWPQHGYRKWPFGVCLDVAQAWPHLGLTDQSTHPHYKPVNGGGQVFYEWSCKARGTTLWGVKYWSAVQCLRVWTQFRTEIWTQFSSEHRSEQRSEHRPEHRSEHSSEHSSEQRSERSFSWEATKNRMEIQITLNKSGQASGSLTTDMWMPASDYDGEPWVNGLTGLTPIDPRVNGD